MIKNISKIQVRTIIMIILLVILSVWGWELMESSNKKEVKEEVKEEIIKEETIKKEENLEIKRMIK